MSATLTGGEQMIERLQEIEESATDATQVSCGWYEDAVYPDGTYVALVAAMNEFGTKHAPPRPYFRRMINMGEKHWGDDLGKLLVANDFDAKQSLGLMGLELQNELQASIKANAYAPLAPSTVKEKGSTQQLVDTGRMWQSVDSKVE